MAPIRASIDHGPLMQSEAGVLRRARRAGLEQGPNPADSFKAAGSVRAGEGGHTVFGSLVALALKEAFGVGILEDDPDPGMPLPKSTRADRVVVEKEVVNRMDFVAGPPTLVCADEGLDAFEMGLFACLPFIHCERKG